MKMPKTVKVRCNISGDVFQWRDDFVTERLKYYGSLPLFNRYFIRSKYVQLIARGLTIGEIAELENIQLDPTQQAYYSELLSFHRKMANDAPVTEDSTANFAETDEDVSHLISAWAEYRANLEAQK